jgi:hypothetical protein
MPHVNIDTHFMDKFNENDYKVLTYRTKNINDIVMCVNGPLHEVIIHEIYKTYSDIPFKLRVAYIIEDTKDNITIIHHQHEFDRFYMTNVKSFIKWNRKLVEYEYNQCPFMSFKSWLLEEKEDDMWYVQFIDNECETYSCVNNDTICGRYRIFNKANGALFGSIPVCSPCESMNDIITLYPSVHGFNNCSSQEWDAKECGQSIVARES